MKLPSISQAVAGARLSFFRFPFVLLAAITGTVCALILIDHEGPPEPTFLFQVLFAAILAFPLLAGLALTGEKWKWSRRLSSGSQIAGVALVSLYALSVPQDLSGAPNYHLYRLFMLAAALTLFAVAVPYIRHASELGYWNFCKTLLLRVLTAYLYTVVLWAGLAIALAALDNLFGVTIPPKRYGELWVLMNGIFTTWFFLAGIPEDLDSLDGVTHYPRGLKIFSQYILFPLVLIYLVILYAYLGKILLAWDWPEGWVSKLIFGFIGMGLSSLLLLHPIKEQTENIWIKMSSRWFYVIIVPLLVMLCFAVWRRVSEYGITEGRYLAIAAGMWLCILVPYYLISRKKLIRFIPLSLGIAICAACFGPWGMFVVSEKSQVGRLEELLTRNHILVDGRIQSKHDSIQFSETKQISSIISYLAEVHGFEAIQPWFGDRLKVGPFEKRDPAKVARMMGIEYVRIWQFSSGGYVNFMADRDGALVLEGYDRLVRTQRIFSGSAKKEFPDQGLEYHPGKDLGTMTIAVSDKMNQVDSVQFDLQPLINKLMTDYGNATTDQIPVEKMTITSACRTARIKLFFTNLRIQRRGIESRVMSYECEIAYTIVHQ